MLLPRVVLVLSGLELLRLGLGGTGPGGGERLLGGAPRTGTGRGRGPVATALRGGPGFMVHGSGARARGLRLAAGGLRLGAGRGAGLGLRGVGARGGAGGLGAGGGGGLGAGDWAGGACGAERAGGRAWACATSERGVGPPASKPAAMTVTRTSSPRASSITEPKMMLASGCAAS